MYRKLIFTEKASFSSQHSVAEGWPERARFHRGRGDFSGDLGEAKAGRLPSRELEELQYLTENFVFVVLKLGA